jgi:lipopolysaccharide biosynthesis glycosyltransferase
VTEQSIYVGWDAREADAYAVAVNSVNRRLSRFIPTHGLVLEDMKTRGLYRRPTERRDGRLWDVISDAPMATEHACARFLVPHLAKRGWALFMDGDMLALADFAELFDSLDPAKALYCVQHRHEPPEGVKMDGQLQTRYARKNWSSLMVFNCDHPANAALTVELVNTIPGRELHRFCWLPDELIGALDPAWNFLVGHTDPSIEPKVLHFTDGVPDMPGYENAPFADVWWAELRRLAA